MSPRHAPQGLHLVELPLGNQRHGVDVHELRELLQPRDVCGTDAGRRFVAASLVVKVGEGAVCHVNAQTEAPQHRPELCEIHLAWLFENQVKGEPPEEVVGVFLLGVCNGQDAHADISQHHHCIRVQLKQGDATAQARVQLGPVLGGLLPAVQRVANVPESPVADLGLEAEHLAPSCDRGSVVFGKPAAEDPQAVALSRVYQDGVGQTRNRIHVPRAVAVDGNESLEELLQVRLSRGPCRLKGHLLESQLAHVRDLGASCLHLDTDEDLDEAKAQASRCVVVVADA
mmetsp:Transcript_37800/g.112844  ORF Transcript_37800/g.112844 Transcript_37800/m.112844 type:complete len:286 (-) Transcript_37800:2185-3042(-)